MSEAPIQGFMINPGIPSWLQRAALLPLIIGSRISPSRVDQCFLSLPTFATTDA